MKRFRFEEEDLPTRLSKREIQQSRKTHKFKNKEDVDKKKFKK